MDNYKDNEPLDKAIETLAADTKAARARRVTMSPTMAAIADIEEILGKLSAKDAIRVLDWVQDSYDHVRTDNSTDR